MNAEEILVVLTVLKMYRSQGIMDIVNSRQGSLRRSGNQISRGRHYVSPLNLVCRMLINKIAISKRASSATSDWPGLWRFPVSCAAKASHRCTCQGRLLVMDLC